MSGMVCRSSCAVDDVWGGGVDGTERCKLTLWAPRSIAWHFRSFFSFFFPFLTTPPLVAGSDAACGARVDGMLL